MAQTEIKKVISIDTKSSNKSINSLKKDIDALTNSLNDLEIGTKEYNETLSLLGKKQLAFNKINEQIARSSRTTAQRFESVAKISTGLASGYGAATAAITLFGKESEDLNKVMVKLQSSIALVQGIGGIKDLLEELPALGNWFKKLTDFISPFNTGLDNAAKNLNKIDAAKRLNDLDLGRLNDLDLGRLNGPQTTTVGDGGFIVTPQMQQQQSQQAIAATGNINEQTKSIEQLRKEYQSASKATMEWSKTNSTLATDVAYFKGRVEETEEAIKKHRAITDSNIWGSQEWELELDRLNSSLDDYKEALGNAKDALDESNEAGKKVKLNQEQTAKALNQAEFAATKLGKA